MTQIADPEPAAGSRAGLDRAELLKLMTWLSPAFPVGAFSYSHGLEWAIDCGAIRDRAALADWLADLVTAGSCWNDMVLFAEAWRAAAALDAARLQEVAALGLALAPSRERRIETVAQGAAFLAHLSAWPSAATRMLAQQQGDVIYPVAVAVAAAGHGIALDDGLAAYGHAFAANLVSAAVRIVPLGQSDGLSVLSGLAELILATAEHAAAAMLEDLGTATMMSDIASMAHETQYSRIFRT